MPQREQGLGLVDARCLRRTTPRPTSCASTSQPSRPPAPVSSGPAPGRVAWASHNHAMTMTQPAYSVARAVAPAVAEHLRLHRRALPPHHPGLAPLEQLPDAQAIEALIDTAFWASVRREEGYIPKISLAFLRPIDEVDPLIFAQPLPLDPSALTRLAAAVERPGIHLGVWPDGDRLSVWGTTHAIPPFCFVVEVVAAGLLVLKHRPRHESRKFVNVAVLEGDRIKIVDEGASRIADCPALLTSMLGFDANVISDEALNVQ